jgi:hypothetical protein
MPLPALQHPSLLETAAALPHVRGLSPARSTTAAPPRPRPVGGRCAQPFPSRWIRAAGQDRDGSRVHCGSLDEGGARLCPCGIAASTPQAFLAASLAACANHLGSSPPVMKEQVRAAPGPDPPGFEPVPHKGAVSHRFLAYSSPSRSPDPAHLAVLARPGFVRAAPALPGTTRIRLPSAPPPCCDRDSGEGLPPPLEPQRLTAHAHAPPYSSHGLAACRGRPRHHRPLDGARKPAIDAALHPRRPQAQGKSPGPDLAAEDQDRQIPPARQAPRIPREPGIMPLT